jgi:hypothetical protein
MKRFENARLMVWVGLERLENEMMLGSGERRRPIHFILINYAHK